MTAQTFAFNNPEGAFRVFAVDGSAVFDSRLQTQKIYLTGTLDMAGRVLVSNGSGGYFTQIDANSTVLYGKTFTKAPYIRSASRRLANDPTTQSGTHDPTYVISGPQVSYTAGPSNNFLNYRYGHYSNAFLDRMYIGNLDPSLAGVAEGVRRFWYAIFENPADGS